MHKATRIHKDQNERGIVPKLRSNGGDPCLFELEINHAEREMGREDESIGHFWGNRRVVSEGSLVNINFFIRHCCPMNPKVTFPLLSGE